MPRYPRDAHEVRARAWCRVDLAGGTLDIWPLGLLHAGARTVNFAIDLGVRVTLRRGHGTYRVRQAGGVIEARSVAELRAHPEAALVGVIAEALELPPVEVGLESDSPRGAGLGASSAMAVALIAAAERLLGRDPSTPSARAHLARDVEARLMSLPTGAQDHYPALLGGALEIVHRPGGEQVRSLAANLEGLGRSLLVVHSGSSHFSAGNNWQVIRQRLEGDEATVKLFQGIAEVAANLAQALESGHLQRVGELMKEEWGYRRRLAEAITTPLVDRLLQLALDLGAWGGKVCGAGGGGCVAILCPAEKRRRIADALSRAGAQILAAAPAADPLEVQVLD